MTTKRTAIDGKRVMDRRLIQVQYRLHHGDQRWRATQPVYPGDQLASCTVFIDGDETIVVFGWRGDRALLWRSTGFELAATRDIRTLVDVAHLPVLADLTDGPVELDGPKGRWRWRVVT